MGRYNVYPIDTLVRVTGDFTTTDGTYVDPDTVTLEITDPSGNMDTYTFGAGQITKTGTGQYKKEITPDEAGLWKYRYVGTGIAATNSYKFRVEST